MFRRVRLCMYLVIERRRYTNALTSCEDCYCIIEENILVSEVGFGETSSGRVTVQGTFVGHGQTGISGFRGGNQQSSEKVKAEGAAAIAQLASRMGISTHASNRTKNLFNLAVNTKFNRGRKSSYVVGSCLYLQCRIDKTNYMLIDFSERLDVNVFELGATYLKLRQTLNLTQVLPVIDPAIYNLRFAHRLDFGEDVRKVSEDASRLVKRFKSDWMTQGRRPAGICGACLIIAGRMSNYLRTPEEVAQVVKVSPLTIKKRLREFGQTESAQLTVDDWRALDDTALGTMNESEVPPIVKRGIVREAKSRIGMLKRERESQSRERQASQQEEDDDGDGGEEEEEDSGRTKKRKLDKDLDLASAVQEAVAAYMVDPRDRPTASFKIDLSQPFPSIAKNENDKHDDEEEDEDDNMAELEAGDYVNELAEAGDNPDEVRAERMRDKKHFMREVRKAKAADLETLAEDVEEKEEGGAEDGDNSKEEEDELQDIKDQKTEHPDWDDVAAVHAYIEKKYFGGCGPTVAKDKPEDYRAWMQLRITNFVGNRSPQEVLEEMEVVEKAREARERGAKERPEAVFDDLDDDELDSYWVMGDDEKEVRARMWLSHNGTWLEQDKERQERKRAYNKAHGIDPNKPKPKRKRNAPHKGPYTSTQAAVTSFASQKKMSSRINWDSLRKLGLKQPGGADSDDEKNDEGADDNENEKHDEDNEDDIDFDGMVFDDIGEYAE
ncbi:transcription factor IIIB 90 kDa subunit, partial [Tremellales sp. Uapishka_1]